MPLFVFCDKVQNKWPIALHYDQLQELLKPLALSKELNHMRHMKPNSPYACLRQMSKFLHQALFWIVKLRSFA